MKLLFLTIFLLINNQCWSSKGKKKPSIWPRNKVTLSDSYLPAVAQLLTYLLDQLAEQEAAAAAAAVAAAETVDGAEAAPVVLLSPPPAIVNETTTARTIIVDIEDKLKENVQGAASKKPTTVEVILGKLRDMLVMEAKRQGFQKIQGFSRSVLDTLRKSSRGTSEEQLKSLIELMLKNNNIKRRESLTQAALLLESLEMQNGPLPTALGSIPALMYTL